MARYAIVVGMTCFHYLRSGHVRIDTLDTLSLRSAVRLAFSDRVGVSTHTTFRVLIARSFPPRGTGEGDGCAEGNFGACGLESPSSRCASPGIIIIWRRRARMCVRTKCAGIKYELLARTLVHACVRSRCVRMCACVLNIRHTCVCSARLVCAARIAAARSPADGRCCVCYIICGDVDGREQSVGMCVNTIYHILCEFVQRCACVCVCSAFVLQSNGANAPTHAHISTHIVFAFCLCTGFGICAMRMIISSTSIDVQIIRPGFAAPPPPLAADAALHYDCDRFIEFATTPLNRIE